MEEVVERTTARLTVSFFDPDKAPAAPGSITYSVWDHRSKTELRSDTVVTPGSTVQIVLDANDTQILNEGRAVEERRVLVKTTYGTDDELNGIFWFKVLNLEGLAGPPP